MEPEPNKMFVYDGFMILEPLTGLIGLPIDQVNFLVCQLVAILLGYVFRTQLSPGKASAEARHMYMVVVGIALTYFCFGSQILHLFAQVLIAYILMNTLKPGVMEKAVFVAAMFYLAMCHIYRVVYNYGGYTLDITGPLMINTQRLACLAYSLKDGSVKDESKLSPTMKYHATKNWPKLLEFCSYVFCFTTCMCGPFCFYKDYIKFIEGTDYKTGDKDDDTKKPPSPVGALMRTLGWTVINGLAMMLLIPRYPIEYMMENGFIKLNFFLKTFYMVVSTTLMRSKYYFAWKLAQSVNQSAGLGYAGKDSDGNEQWDLIDNADIVKVETSLSLKVLLDNWNKTTTYWLRYVVYERFQSTLAVFFVSAFWHGFYAGYYITFMSGAVFVNASKLVRRKIRPLFLTNNLFALTYHTITCLFTRVAIAYLVFPFVIMEFWPSMAVYRSMYFWFHIAVGIFMAVLSNVPSPKPATKTQ